VATFLKLLEKNKKPKKTPAAWAAMRSILAARAFRKGWTIDMMDIEAAFSRKQIYDQSLFRHGNLRGKKRKKHEKVLLLRRLLSLTNSVFSCQPPFAQLSRQRRVILVDWMVQSSQGESIRQVDKEGRIIQRREQSVRRSRFAFVCLGGLRPNIKRLSSRCGE
jgi:hypothetical protein